MNDDEDNNIDNEYGQDTTPSLDVTQQKSKELLAKSMKKAQNLRRKIKAKGPKLKIVKKMQERKEALKQQAAAGAEKTIRGTSKMSKGLGIRASGKATEKSGKAIEGVGKLIAPYVGPAIAGAIVTKGKQLEKKGQDIDKKGKQVIESGKEELKAGANQLNNTRKGIIGPSESSRDNSGDNTYIPRPQRANPMRVMQDAIKKSVGRRAIRRYVLPIIILLAIALIIILVILTRASEKNDGTYKEGDMSNVPYVVKSQLMDSLTIVANADGGYSYGFVDSEGNIISLDEAVDNALDILEQNGSNALSYLGKNRSKQKETLKKMVQAEVATQYPDLKDSDSTIAGSSGGAIWSGDNVHIEGSGLYQRSYTFSDGETWYYYLYVPETVNSNKPLMVYQHGNGHMGHDYSKLSGSSSDHSFSYLVANKGVSYNAYVLEPQLPEGHWWSEADTAKLKTLVDYVVEENGINKNRISLWGFSMGSERIEFNVADYPNFYSCLVICARSTGYLQKNIPNNIPVYLAYDKRDGYSNSGTPKLYRSLISAGFNAEIKEFQEGLGHYETVTRAIQSQEIMSWVLSQGAGGTTFVDTEEETITQSESTNTTQTVTPSTTTTTTTTTTAESETTSTTTTSESDGENTQTVTIATQEGTTTTTTATAYDELNGNIKIQRIDENGNAKDLTFISESAFDSLMSSKSDEVMNYYTLKKTAKSDSSTSTGGTSDALFNYVASWENGYILQYLHGTGSYSNRYVQGYITEDGKNYICRTDEGLNNGTKNYGYGVMISRYGVPNNVSYFSEHGIDITDSQYLIEKVSTLPVDIVNQVSMKIQADDIKTIEQKASAHGVSLTTEQKHALVDIMYQFGPSGANLDKLMELYKTYGVSEELKNNYTSLGGSHIFLKGKNDGTNSEGISRNEARWLLFSKGEYHYGVDVTWDISSDSSVSSQSNSSTADGTSYSQAGAGKVDSNGVTLTSGGNLEFLEAAIKAHAFIRNEGYTYQSDHGGRHLPVLAKANDYKGQIDCSAYVSMALEYYGKTDWSGYPWELTPSSLVTYGKDKLETVFDGKAYKVADIPNLQSGDIILFSGHTQIFYGYNSNGTPVWLNAGSTGAIKDRPEGTDAYDLNVGFPGNPVLHVYRVPNGSGSTSGRTAVTSLDNFLFIGDSRYSTTATQIATLGNNIKNVGVGSARVDEWLAVANNGGKGKVQSTDVDITGTYSGISVQLGANSVYNNVDNATSQMKEFLTKLKELHPGTPIFVNSCLSVNSNATSSGYTWDVTTMKDCIKSLNNNMSEFCSQTADLYFVDISDGLEDENGFVKLEYESDGLHCNGTSSSIFAENVKKAILSAGATTGTDDGSQNNSNANSTYSLVVASKKLSTTTIVDNYEYSYTYGIGKNSGVKSTGLSQSTATPSPTTKSSTSELTYNKTTGDYQEAMSHYTLYFDFLWAILVQSSGNTEIVEQWADLAINGTTTITAYNEQSSSSSSSTVNAGTFHHTNYDANSSMAIYDVYNVKETTTTTTRSTDSKLAITNADTWLVHYENEADSYREFQAKTKETITEKTSMDDENDNIIKILRNNKSKLKDMVKGEELLDEMLEENTKVDFMIDVYSYVLQVAQGYADSELTVTLDGIDLLNTSVFDLASSKDLVAQKALLYDKLNITEDEKELLYKAVEIICGDLGDDEANTERKKKVTSVVLNRVMSSEFPNSVEKVLKKGRDLPNFKPSQIKSDISISESTKTAVNEVLEKGDCSDYSVYVNTKEKAEKSKWAEEYKASVTDDNVFSFFTTEEVEKELKKYEVITGYSNSGSGGSYAATDLARRMVEWAEQQVGKSSYASPRGGSQISKGYCAAFVHNAYAAVGIAPAGGNGIDCPHPNPMPYNADGTVNWSQIPVGACIVSTSSSVYGHVALYVGNGYVIEGGANTIAKNHIDHSWGTGRYVGWGYDVKDQAQGASLLSIRVSGRSGNYAEGWTLMDDSAQTGIVGYYTNAGRTYNVYSQSLGPWKGIRYSQGTYSSSACGGTSAAIIASAVDESATPVETGQIIYRHVGATYGTNAGGVTTTDAVRSALDAYGIRYEVKSSPSNAEIISHLEQGLPIYTCVASRSIGAHFYKGHYLTLLGIDESGRIFLGDPANGGSNAGYYDQSSVLPLTGWCLFIYFD